jgi:hypothetical protein
VASDDLFDDTSNNVNVYLFNRNNSSYCSLEAFTFSMPHMPANWLGTHPLSGRYGSQKVIRFPGVYLPFYTLVRM